MWWNGNRWLRRMFLLPRLETTKPKTPYDFVVDTTIVGSDLQFRQEGQAVVRIGPDLRLRDYALEDRFFRAHHEGETAGFIPHEIDHLPVLDRDKRPCGVDRSKRLAEPPHRSSSTFSAGDAGTIDSRRQCLTTPSRGLYERLVTRDIENKLLRFDPARTRITREGIDPAEAPGTLARHVERVLERVLDGLPEDQRTTKQAEFTNRLSQLLSELDSETADETVKTPPEETARDLRPSRWPCRTAQPSFAACASVGLRPARQRAR